MISVSKNKILHHKTPNKIKVERGVNVEERWKKIPKNKIYAVSNLGNVKNTRTGKILKREILNSGYARIKLKGLNNNGDQLVHRMVAESFIPNPDNKPVVNHKDADRMNNRVDNLEWVTHAENIADMANRGTLNTYTARESLRLGKPVQQVCQDTGKVIDVWESMKEASEETGITRRTISKECKGGVGQNQGIRWEFVSPDDKVTTKSINKGKLVVRTDNEGNEVKFETIISASESIDVHRSTLTRWLSKSIDGEKVAYGGYMWELE